MPVAASARRRSPLNYWPGFVDALSTLLLSIVFLLSVFMLAQFFLAQEITSKETVLDRLNRQIAELSDPPRRSSAAQDRVVGRHTYRSLVPPTASAPW